MAADSGLAEKWRTMPARPSRIRITATASWRFQWEESRGRDMNTKKSWDGGIYQQGLRGWLNNFGAARRCVLGVEFRTAGSHDARS